MESSDDHTEFAIVVRMRELLEGDHRPYEVTATYAHFMAILCWVTQRIRSSDQSTASQAAARVWAQLGQESLRQAPWNFSAKVIGENVRLLGTTLPEEFQSHTAQRLVKNLRDAVAHGDSRNVEPYHEGKCGRAERTLVGLTFRCTERDRGRETWSGDITLRRGDLVRIASELANRFCAAMKEASGTTYLEEDAKRGLVEAA